MFVLGDFEVFGVMLEDRECVSALLAVFAGIFILCIRKRIAGVPFHTLLFAAFACIACSWVLSVAEAFVWEEGLNFLQHLFSGLSGLLLALWAYKVGTQNDPQTHGHRSFDL